MALAPEEIEARLGAVADLVRPLLPAGWLDATLSYHALGSFEALTLTCYGAADGGSVAGSGVVERLRDLRRDCHDPETGTWPGLTLHLDSADDRWGVEPEDIEDFTWRAEVTPDDCALELAEFPRPDWLVPPWMNALLDLKRAADSFDPAEILARPRPEDALLDGTDSGYFARARGRLDDFLPGGGDRVLIGRLEEGRWSVVPAGSAWLAVRYAGGRCESGRAFAGPREAFAHAAARVMAAEGIPVDSDLLKEARVLGRGVRPRNGLDAWTLDDAGRDAVALTGDSPRPPEEERESFIALTPLMNRPGGYFVCESGPPPGEGPFIAVRKVFELALSKALPPMRERPPAPAAAPATASAEPEPAMGRPGPATVLPEGTEVDAYEHHDQRLVYSVGTPDHLRGMYDHGRAPIYHAYRVEKPITAVPASLAPLPAFSDEEEAERARTDQGQGFYLGAEIGELLRSGHLSEIGGSPPAPRTIARTTIDLTAPPPSGAPAVRQRPRPYDVRRRDELLSRLRELLEGAAPQGWARIDLRIAMTVEVGEIALAVVMADGGHAEVEPPSGIAEIAAELRSMMYRPDEGTWFGMRFTMDPPGGHQVHYNEDFDPGWTTPLAPSAWRHDLSVFPRTAEHVPRWLRDRLGEGGRGR
ncbi:glycohydrolase toxin TNT-related protein [Spirillospora sp. NPDC029432]|uniref:glycohydrolase toxin TNT-related protein n=1 Tax=Spirillospora sp. NPDC029432 TaxID=3154599 RepID=UPI0034560279